MPTAARCCCNAAPDARAYQVGWDSNDYQIDVGTAAGRAEYKRMIDRCARNEMCRDL